MRIEHPAQLSSHRKPGFLGLGATDTLGRNVLCCGDCPLRCRELSSILGLCPLDANGTSSPRCDNKKGQRRPLGTDLKGLRDQGARGDLAGAARRGPQGPVPQGTHLIQVRAMFKHRVGSVQEDLLFYYLWKVWAEDEAVSHNTPRQQVVCGVSDLFQKSELHCSWTQDCSQPRPCS